MSVAPRYFSAISSRLKLIWNGAPISYLWVNSVAALVLTAIYNNTLWARLYDIVGFHSPSSSYFYIAFFLLATAVCFALLTIISFLPGYKWCLMALFMVSAMGGYFIDQYGVYIDSEMITNVLQTDTNEVADLLSLGFIIHGILFGLLPALLIYRLTIKPEKGFVTLLKKATTPLIALTTAICICLPVYQTFASVMRAHKEVRYLVTPSNIIYGVIRAVSESEKISPVVGKLDETAALGDSWATAVQKPLLFVFVVGETARADHFSLEGYSRNTNPNLQLKDIIYFNHVSSCGTSTAISLPCIFSNDTREDFSRKSSSEKENLLDLIAQAGLNVLWVDNNSGCKGVCLRTEQFTINHQSLDCDSEHCFDLAMLQALETPADTDTFMVLHQLGSHGPSYYKQTPDDQKAFLPDCETSQLQDCSQEEIINAYDNTILYTDLFLSKTIERLGALSERYNTALLYVSDHGESLGENGIYLHAAPYFMAPEEQTHVPMLAWLSNDFASRFGIDKGCLKAHADSPLSHDNIYSSLLGVLDIESTTYDSQLDLFAPCMNR